MGKAKRSLQINMDQIKQILRIKINKRSLPNIHQRDGVRSASIQHEKKVRKDVLQTSLLI